MIITDNFRRWRHRGRLKRIRQGTRIFLDPVTLLKYFGVVILA